MATYDNDKLVLANSLMIYINDKPIAFAKSADLSISQDSIDVTSKMSGKWKASLPGTLSYTLSSDFLYTDASGLTSYSVLFDAMVSQQNVNIEIGLTTDQTTYAMTKGLYSGLATIKSLSQKGGDTGVIECSVSLDGAGALTKIVI